MIKNRLASENEIKEFIRVDHAGELGAIMIYKGQKLAFRLKRDAKNVKLVEEMEGQEEEHLNYFKDKIIEQKVRPTAMQPLWKIVGFASGFLSAAISSETAMAVTASVEEVIDEHYLSQLEKLDQTTELGQKISKFRDDEIHHRDIAYEENAKNAPLFSPLSFAVKAATKLAISISSKV